MLLVLIAGIPAIQSCDLNDDDSGHYNNLGLATVHKIKDSTDLYFLLETAKQKLYPCNTNNTSLASTLKDSGRVWIGYNVTDMKTEGYDKTIDLINIQKILTKKVIDLTPSNEEEIGDNYMELLDFSITGKYLNLWCNIPVCDGNKTLVNVVNNTISEDPVKEDYVTLEFRCNAHDNEKCLINYQQVMISFYIGDYVPEGKKGIFLRYNDRLTEKPKYICITSDSFLID
jgi:hypothetical protein